MTKNPVVSFARNLRSRASVWKQIREMQRALGTYRPKAREVGPLRRLLIVPPDPWTLVGSKGDEAMMYASIERLRDQAPELKVAVMTATPLAESAALALGFEALSAWSCSMEETIRKLEIFDADAMVVVGADVMDGYYSPVTAARMLLTAEAAAKRAVRVSILGFSFNSSPDRRMQPVFDGLNERIAVNVRDPTSFERFQRFSKVRSQLVADAAFMLKPDSSNAEARSVADWALRRREAGDIVLGFNMHPTLIRDAEPSHVARLIASALAALRNVCNARKISLLFISHDYRPSDGDDVCLEPIARELQAEMGSRLMYPRGKFSAAQLKFIAGIPDGVVTGRMHLAIATLGMGRPVAALTYQDKFQGLFRHFTYPERFLLAPQAAAAPAQFTAMINDFIDELPALIGLVSQHLPAVLRASRLNLQNLHEPDSQTV